MIHGLLVDRVLAENDMGVGEPAMTLTPVKTDRKHIIEEEITYVDHGKFEGVIPLTVVLRKHC